MKKMLFVAVLFFAMVLILILKPSGMDAVVPML